MKTRRFFVLPSVLGVLAVLAVLGSPAPARAAVSGKWNKLEDCVLADGYMDGDSFHIRHKNKDIIIRLYFVDTPETDKTHEERNKAQADYFGIKDTQVIPVGQLGKKFTQKTLKGERFTVWTRWEDAMGSSQQKRYFGIVQVGKDDLAELLVANGLARVYGASAVMPSGRGPDDEFARLRQLEHRAKAKRLGAWSKAAKKGALREDGGGMFDLAEDDGGEGGEGGGRRPFAQAWDDEDFADLGEYHDKWANVPTVAFLRAEAFINTERFEDAEIEMRKLLIRFPSHPQRPRIEFYLALSLAMQEEFGEAVSRFKDWLAKYPDHPLAPDVRYWMPISLYYDGKYKEALPLFDAYAKQNPYTVYAPEADYRAACCRYALEDYEGAAAGVAAFLRDHPDHYFRHEAAIMRGDALAALGEFDAAKEAYRIAMVPAAGPFYYMALTQAARLHKALAEPEEYREMSREFVQYIKDMPQDSNIIDAAYQAGWALRQTGESDKARRLYWQMIELHGNVPAWEGFDLMLADLAKLYPRGTDEYDQDLRARHDRALADRRIALAARLDAARIQRLPAESQTAAVAAFAGRYNTDDLGPETLVWIGREWFDHGMVSNGTATLEFLLDRYGESRHAPEAQMLLARQEVADKRWDDAFGHADAVVNGAADLDIYVEAVFLRAEALRGLGRNGEAITAYNEILANRAAPRRLKPDALLGIAACLCAQNEWNQANAYYQRVYVLYGAYKKQVAAAYLGSAACFEHTREPQKAIATYDAFLETDASRGTAEAATARQRRAALSQGATP
ncbi:MAG: tetratricopeptide repeat protein [Kiritimatiellae bacterium]|nr:tetratricopeptide repeat protein [Kiritimatiellia bacterium]